MKSKLPFVTCFLAVQFLIEVCDSKPEAKFGKKSLGRFASGVAGAALGNLLASHINPAEKQHHHYYGNPPTISIQPVLQNGPVMTQQYQLMAPSQAVIHVAASPTSVVSAGYPQNVPVITSQYQPVAPVVHTGYQSQQQPVNIVVSTAPVASVSTSPTQQYQPMVPATLPVAPAGTSEYPAQQQPVNSVVSTAIGTPMSSFPTRQHQPMAPTLPIVPYAAPITPAIKTGYQQQPQLANNSFNSSVPVAPVSTFSSQQHPVAPAPLTHVAPVVGQQQPVGFVVPLSPTISPATVQPQQTVFNTPSVASINSVHYKIAAPPVHVAELTPVLPVATLAQTIVSPPVHVFTTHQQASFGPPIHAGTSQVYTISTKSGVYGKVGNSVNRCMRPGYVAVLLTFMALAFI